MDDLSVRLLADLDTSQPVAAAARMDGAVRTAAAGIDASMKRSQMSVDRTGASLQQVARGGAIAGRSIVAGMNVAAAAAAGADRSIVRMGVSLLSAFATGGPPMLALAAVGAVIGLITSGTDEAAEKARKMGDEIAKWKTGAVDAGNAAREAFSDFGLTETSKLERQIESFKAMAENARRIESIAHVGTTASEMGALRGDLLKAAGEADASGVSGGRERAKQMREQAEQIQNLIQLTKDLEKAERELQNSNPVAVGLQGLVQKRDAAATRQESALRALGAGVAGQGAGADAARRAADLQRDNALIREQSDEYVKQLQIELQIATLQKSFEGALGNELALLGEIAVLGAKIHTLDGLKGEEARKYLKALRDEIAGKREVLSVTQEINVKTADRDLRRQIESAEALFAVDKQRIDLAHQMIDLQRKGASSGLIDRYGSAVRSGNQFRADDPLRDELRTLGLISDERRQQIEIEKFIRDQRRAGASEELIQELAAAKARQPMFDLIRGMGQSISSAMADALVDGAETDFKNAADIGRNLLRAMLSAVMNSLTQSLVGGLMGMLGGGGGGGSGGGGGILSTVVGLGSSLVGGGSAAGAGIAAADC